ncbi:MAG: hypothetical protein EA355_10835, partial [Rhodobacteraceae bacterium]
MGRNSRGDASANRPRAETGCSMAAKRKGPRQDPLDAAEAAVGRLAAVGGLDLAVGAVWRFETPEPWSGARARTLLAAGALAGAAILGRPG